MSEIASPSILDGALSSPTARGFVADVLEAFDGSEVDYSRAAALGTEWFAAGGNDVAGLWRELARLGRAVEESLEEKLTSRGDRRRLRVAVDEATARALDAFAAALRGRRDRWLSFFAHEIRNSLNTLVNAHWIIRNGEGRPADKICDMTDRAVQKLENLVKDLRDLEAQVLKPAPGRQDKV
jgi:signal transduction histidine kinase